MRWYLTNPPTEYQEWDSLKMSRAITLDEGSVSLNTLEPDDPVIGDNWKLLPLTDDMPSVPAGKAIDTREVETTDTEAAVIYTLRDISDTEREEASRDITSRNVLEAPKQGFGGPTGKEIFNGNQ